MNGECYTIAMNMVLVIIGIKKPRCFDFVLCFRYRITYIYFYLNISRFKHHCFSYRGPTVMAILLGNDETLVLAVDAEWRYMICSHVIEL